MEVLTYGFRGLAVPQGELRITTNIKQSDSCYFTEARYGCKWVSSDEDVLPGETAMENVSAVYAAAGLAEPVEFASLAVRTCRHDARNCNAYGPIILVVDADSIKDELLIFNGDVKNLGAKLQGEDRSRHSEWVEIHTLSESVSEIISAFGRLVQNARNAEKPRLVGSYFEARLQRALRPTDIKSIYVPENDRVAMECAQAISRVPETMQR